MVYFIAEFDLLLEINNSSIKLKKDEICYLSHFSQIKITVKPKSLHLETYSLELEKSSNLVNDFYEIRRLKKGDILIVLKPKVRYLQSCYNEEEFDIERNKIKVRYFKQEYGLVQVFFKNNKYQYKCSTSFDINCFSKKVCDKNLVFIEIKTVRNFYFIFSGKKLLFAGYIKEINENDNCLMLMQDDENCYGQKQVCSIDLKTEKEEKFLVYYDERQMLDCFDIRYLFLDAVLIKNKELAHQYLSEDLKSFEFDILVQFFEDFDDYFFIEDNCILRKDNDIIKILNFDIENDIIVNINE